MLYAYLFIYIHLPHHDDIVTTVISVNIVNRVNSVIKVLVVI